MVKFATKSYWVLRFPCHFQTALRTQKETKSRVFTVNVGAYFKFNHVKIYFTKWFKIFDGNHRNFLLLRFRWISVNLMMMVVVVAVWCVFFFFGERALSNSATIDSCVRAKFYIYVLIWWWLYMYFSHRTRCFLNSPFAAISSLRVHRYTWFSFLFFLTAYRTCCANAR